MPNALQHLKDAISENNGAKIIAMAKEVASSETIVELPCKVGDTVWVMITKQYISLDRGLNKGIVTRIVLIQDSNNLCIQFHNDYGVTEMPFDFKNIGKTVFLTKPEALEKLEEGNI